MLKALHDQREDFVRRLEIVNHQVHLLGDVVLITLGITIPKGTDYHIDFDNNKIIYDSVEAGCKTDPPG